MKIVRSESAEKPVTATRAKRFTKIRLTFIASFVFIALTSGVAFSANAAANDSLSNLLFNSQTVLKFLGNAAPDESKSLVQSSLIDEESTSRNVARSGHTATDLGGGKVLLVGGDANGTTSVFDVSAGIFTASANLSAPRINHTATKLPDGRVLIAGGDGGNGAGLNSTEIYDPATGKFTAGPDLTTGRTGQTATVLTSGKILIVGGDAAGSAEILSADQSSAPVSALLNNARSMHSATLMKDGKVLIVGGKDASGNALESAEIFDGSLFTATGNAMAHHRVKPLLRVLHDGKVQIIGGSDDESMEVYDPADNIFGAHAHLIPVEDEHAALLKTDILSAPTRAGLIRSGSSDVQLNRSNHTITEISGNAKAVVFGGANNSGALDTFAVFNSSNATVSTDKLDYQPGQTARISGTGWQAGETVNITIHEDPHTHTERRLTATADANGNFTANYSVEEHDLNVKFILGAKGQASGRTAQTTFTDAREFRATITPTSVNTSQSATYTITIKNTNTGQTTTQLASVSILLPTGYGNPTLGTISAPAGKTWTTIKASDIADFNNGYNSNSRLIGIKAGTSSQLDNTESVTVQVTTTAPATANSYEWTTTAYSNLNLNGNTFTIQATPGQPTVTVNAANNPVPTTTSISPSSKTAGDNSFTMTVNGTNFVSGSVVKFNGSNRATTFVSSTQLTASIQATDAATAGTYPITVFNPAPGGGTSNSQTFTVNAANSAPTINRTNATVMVNEGSQATNSGAWSDSEASNSVTLTASVGTVTKGGTNASGTWNWSYTPTDGPAQSQSVTITANDGAGGVSTTTFGLTVNNVAPTGSINVDSSVDEGSGTFVFLIADFNDASSNDRDAGFEYGFTCNGSTYTAFTGTKVYPGQNIDSSCPKSPSGTRTVGARIRDKDGGVTIITKDVIVRAQTSVTMVSGSGTFGGGTATLTAKLASGSTNLSGKSVGFTFNGNPAGTGTTDANGVATKTVSLSGVNAGTFANAVSAAFAGDTDYAGSGGSGALEVAKANQTINDFGAIANKTFGDGSFTVSATATSGLPVSFDRSGNCSITGSTVTITGAGSCTITAKQVGNENYSAAADVPQSFSIAKAVQEITFTNAPQNAAYNTTFNVTATATSGLSVTVAGTPGVCSVSNLTVTMTSGTGVCTLTATQAGNDNYNAAQNKTQTTNATKAAATISLGNLTHAYDGTDKIAQSSTDPTGLNVSVAYTQNNSPVVAPRDAGSYAVSASINDANFQGSTTGTLVINKAAATINLGNLTQTYNGSAKSASAETNPIGLSGVSITYNGSLNVPTNAGSYAVVASLTNANYEAPNASGTLVIEKASASIVLSGLSHTFDGAVKAATAVTTPSGLTFNLAYSQNGSPITPANAGSYVVTATVTDANYQGSASGTLVINRAALTAKADNKAITFGGAEPAYTFRYEGLAMGDTPAVIDTPPTCGVGGAHTNAGSYAIACSGGADNNYAFNYVNGTLLVNKAAPTINFTSTAPSTLPFNGTYAPTAETNSDGALSISASGACSISDGVVTINAGSGKCTITASVAEGTNYLSGSAASQQITATKAAASIALSNLEHIYNGAAKFAAATTTPQINNANLEGVSIAYKQGSTVVESPTNAGSYIVIATLNNLFYELPEVEGVRQATGTLVIGKATQTITWSNPAAIVYGTALGATQLNATVAGVEGGSASGALTYAPEAGTVLDAGNRTLKVTATETVNYNEAVKQVSIAVTPANTTTSANNASAVFGSNSVTLSAAVTNASTSAVVNQGTVTFTVKSGSNVLGTTSGAVSGNAASATLPLGNAFVFGNYAVEAVYTNSVNPANFNGSSDATPGTLSVTPKNTTTVVSVNPASVQYSDLVTFSATVSPNSLNGQNAAGTVKFFVGNVEIGSASVDTNSGTASTTKAIAAAPGTYDVRAEFSSTNLNFDGGTSSNKQLTVNKEDARIYYTGMTFVNTANATSSAATVMLSATIKDITAETADPAYDASAGNIGNATVTFINRDNNTPISGCSNLPVQMVNADTKVGTAACNWSVNIGAAESDDFTVGIIVNNYYRRDASTDNEVITVSKPISTNFITGGGQIINADCSSTGINCSAGQFAGAPGLKTNFGFNVKYNNSGRSLQGRVNVIVRAASGKVYQIKGNQMDTLTVNNSNLSARTAVYTGKANITDITDPLVPISLGGGHTFQMKMTDKGEPGSADMIGVTVYSNNGGAVLFSSNWNGTTTAEQLLRGGNLVVR